MCACWLGVEFFSWEKLWVTEDSAFISASVVQIETPAKKKKKIEINKNKKKTSGQRWQPFQWGVDAQFHHKVAECCRFSKARSCSCCGSEANLCSDAWCVWTAAQPGGSVEQTPLKWTSQRVGSVHSAEDCTPSSPVEQRRGGGCGVSWAAPGILTFPDGLRVEGRALLVGSRRTTWRGRCAGDALACADREGRGLGSPGTDARLIGSADRLRESHLRTTLEH